MMKLRKVKVNRQKSKVKFTKTKRCLKSLKSRSKNKTLQFNIKNQSTFHQKIHFTQESLIKIFRIIYFLIKLWTATVHFLTHNHLCNNKIMQTIHSSNYILTNIIAVKENKFKITINMLVSERMKMIFTKVHLIFDKLFFIYIYRQIWQNIIIIYIFV